ncbi:MAG: hypothetical protein HY905_06145 [Deltaproteobacteria bacterium]|nr:hypothetical protein [Deltaproteobacteria bacterium]
MLLAACNVEHYQLIPDWTPDDSTDTAEESLPDVTDESPAEDAAEESEADDEDDGGGEDGEAVICGEPAEDGDLPCPLGLVCCEEGEIDRCYELSADPDHCGSCDRECESGQECAGGFCLDP